jgi:hypothetical protein
VADWDVPGGNGTGGNAAGGDGDEAVWQDLIARFGEPVPTGEAAPWPEREDLAGSVRVTPVMPPPIVPEALPREPPTNPTGLPGMPVLGGVSMPDAAVPDQPAADQPWPGLAAGTGPRDVAPADDAADEHYVPPVPPPLPRLDPVTKGAWVALFGGPLYLLIATAVGATISGLAAFLAVAAFVGGFVILVLRMDNGRPPNSGSGDDGAVV